jgi:hypothetical protein
MVYPILSMKMTWISFSILASLILLTSCGGGSESFSGSKEMTPVFITPSAPTSMGLLSGESPSSNPNPQVRLYGASEGAEIYTNSSCEGAPFFVATSDTFILPPLRPGKYEFYARAYSGSERSECSQKLLDYQALMKLPMSFSYGKAVLENLKNIVVADLDNDGHDDFVFVTDKETGISFGTGNNSRTTKVFEIPRTATAIKITDMDGDNLKDVLLGDDEKNLHIFRNNGGRIFFYAGVEKIKADIGAIDEIEYQDFNDDRVKDTLIHTNDGQFLVKLSQVDGSFSEYTPVLENAGITQFQLIDMNGDKLVDVVSKSGSTFDIHLNILGTFPEKTSVETSLAKGDGIVADVNGDGLVDVIVASKHEIKVKLANAVGEFGLEKMTSTFYSFSPSDIKVRDVNGDGPADLLFYDKLLKVLSISKGNGDGTFGTPVLYPLSSQFSYEVLDFNGDGRADILSNRPLFQN